MELKSKVFRIITPFKGESKFDFWKQLKIGDKIQISTLFKSTGRGRNGIYVPTVTITNLTNNTEFRDTINSLLNYISKIEFAVYEEIHPPESLP
jgi:hypothetical protein